VWGDVFSLQVPLDTDRARVEAAVGQRCSQVNDFVAERFGSLVGLGFRDGWAALNRVDSSLVVTLEESVNVGATVTVKGCRFGHGQALVDDGQDDNFGFRHGARVSLKARLISVIQALTHVSPKR
jgi:hypothetical protein